MNCKIRENGTLEEIRDIPKLPIDRKMCLTIEETAEYSSIGINKIRELAKNPRNKFTLSVGAKTLIKRKEFEEYINGVSEI